jgi:putative transcriptional regulator
MGNDPFQSLKGQSLMAMPSLMDPNFAKTVTCISEHNRDGAVGIVVNRIHPVLNVKLILDELKIPCQTHAEDFPIHIGGPVHSNELFILHGPPFRWDGMLPVTEELALSNSKDILEAIGQGDGPEQFIIALGCAGWGGGQLEWEMKQNAWLIAPSATDIIFEIPEERRWESAIRRMGIDPDHLVDTAGNA